MEAHKKTEKPVLSNAKQWPNKKNIPANFNVRLYEYKNSELVAEKGKTDYFLKTKKMVGNTTSDESFIYNNHLIRHGEKTRPKENKLLSDVTFAAHNINFVIYLKSAS